MTIHMHAGKRSAFKVAGVVAVTTAIAGMISGPGAAWADTAPVRNAKVTVPAGALSVADIESRLVAQGFKVKEIEVRDLIAEVEGYDAQGREVELVIDRRSGETLAHEYDR